MIRPDLGLSLNDVDPSTVQPAFVERLGKRIRVHERPPCCIHEHRALLHPFQELLVHNVVRRSSARGEDEHNVALARELVERHAAQLAHPVLGRERSVGSVVRGRGRVRGVQAVLEAEGDEAGERRLCDATEADETCGALGRGGRCAELLAAPYVGGPDEVWPLSRRENVPSASRRRIVSNEMTCLSGLDDVQGLFGVSAGHERQHDG